MNKSTAKKELDRRAENAPISAEIHRIKREMRRSKKRAALLTELRLQKVPATCQQAFHTPKKELVAIANGKA
jgi:hypothetical protein